MNTKRYARRHPLIEYFVTSQKRDLLGTSVLIGGLLLSFFAWKLSLRYHEDVANSRFQSTTELMTTAIQRRMTSHEQILRGGVALFNMNNDISREQWRKYVSSLKLDENYPGIQGLGFALRIKAEDKDKHVAQIRSEGYPEYSIHPDSPRPEYLSVIFIEPFWGRNLRAFGYDMTTEQVRKSGLDQARDTGEPTLTGKVTLVQESNKSVQAGFLMYIPVYKSDMPRGTIEERRAALFGYVYSPFRAEDMLRNTLANVDANVAMEIYDGKETQADALLYASTPNLQSAHTLYQAIRQVEFNGRTWTIRTFALPGFDTESRDFSSYVILAAGIALTVLVTLVFKNLAATKNRASRMAKDMTEQLSKSENTLRAILDSAADGIITFDQQGEILTLNLAAEHIFGVSEKQFSGKQVDSLIAEMSMNRLAELFEQHGNAGSSTHTARFESFGLRASGDRFPLSVSLSEFRQGEKINYSMMVRDVTDDKMAEAVLQLRLRAIEASNNGIAISDMSYPGQPIIYTNPAFERITGYSASDILGTNCRILQGEDTQQPEIAQLRSAIQEGRFCHVMLRNYRKDGTLFWNDLSIMPVHDHEGRVTHFVSSQNDVTDRVLAQDALRIRTNRLNAICTLSPDGFVAFDTDGRVTNVNPAFLQMTGLRENELQGLSMYDFDAIMESLHDPRRPYSSIFEAVGYEESMEQDEAVESIQHMLYLHKPEPRILLRSLRSGADGHQEKVIYFRDVTRETEVDRIKSEFLSTAAHELRTPMSSIFGFSELLLHRKYDDDTRREIIGTINRQAGVMINLINELLDLARIEARAGKDFKCSVQALGPIVENALAALLVHNDPRRVSINIPTELPVVNVDAEKFAQALINVLSNAYKYSPNGGNISLDVRTQAVADTIFVGVRIEDHGIGLTPEQLARLFERFFRADPSGNIPGTGLGMCIVKEIVELHGGHVEVVSEKDRGTTVTLWIPSAVMHEDEVVLVA